MKMLQFRHRFQSVLLFAALCVSVSLHATELDIRSFGAKGDGVSDETVCLTTRSQLSKLLMLFSKKEAAFFHLETESTLSPDC